jgi:hypothetical protein
VTYSSGWKIIWSPAISDNGVCSSEGTAIASQHIPYKLHNCTVWSPNKLFLDSIWQEFKS